jgi:ABC-type lipoprotein release transport system permease subunit
MEQAPTSTSLQSHIASTSASSGSRRTMNLSEAVAISASSLWAYKLRSVLTLIGIVSGLYPAWKAAPVEALRYE